MKKQLIFIILVLCFLHYALFGSDGYLPHPHLSKQLWDRVEPYLLPADHPIKGKLDDIFSRSRAILNTDTLKKAGFSHYKPRQFTHLIVTTHPELKGYIIKTYLDAQRKYKKKTEYDFWILRIQGAERIRSLVNEKGWTGIFKIPKKWIYALPSEPSPPKEFFRKNFILVEEDMGLLSNEENLQLWGKAAPDLLNKIYEILETIGLYDCPKPDNIPFSTDGKIAFIDTQTFDTWPVKYEKLTPHLSPAAKTYWKKLIKNQKK